MAAQWQIELADAVSDPAELLRLLELDDALLSAARAAAGDFPLRVPRSFVARMRKRDPADPLLRQVLPLGAELEAQPGFSDDAVGDLASRAAPGVLHKYHGRALLITTGACAVNCRYCFRRHFPYADENARSDHWQSALRYISADSSIGEVILSGGDPLSLNDRILAELVASLQQIPHLHTLRIHSRQPIVLPARVDTELLEWLSRCRLRKVMVVHANHARELNAEVAEAFAKLQGAGATLFNQSVLLKGVNDSAEALAELSRQLFAAGAIPYYLNLLDRVRGTAHFEVPEARARDLMRSLRAQLPGYLVPRLVREIPGAPCKTPLTEI
ncbi:MAG: EF-P beta-lysylation protein EpmB [Gammaproteobacteria bacterium]|nr:EF-P beta-lysylation protein EpmB [Gammaproteobacteria bacterium]MDE2460389.1 EF-P beta-lysylation protein EpmB [Gammaproteobacteria bacterium]